MKKIFWADLEMTGLDPEDSVIIEFAGIVTDLDLNPLAHFEAVVFQPEAELLKMNEWNLNTHTESGLLSLVPTGIPIAQVEQEVLSFLRCHFPDERPVLAGNSIHQDRKFIDRYMKELGDFLHYRMIDVSSFKQIFKSKFAITYDKNTPHRAVEDITASIAELKHYLSFIRID